MGLFSREDTSKKWIFDGENIPNIDSKNKFKGNLVLHRNGKQSKLFFQSDKINTIYLPIDKIKEIQEISSKLTRNILKID